MYIAWGPTFVQFYNDGYRPILGSTKHPAAMGGRAQDTFAESWHIIGPMFDGVRAGHGGRLRGLDAAARPPRLPRGVLLHLLVQPDPRRERRRRRRPRHRHGDDARVLGERRLRTLRDLARAPAVRRREAEAWSRRGPGARGERARRPVRAALPPGSRGRAAATRRLRRLARGRRRWLGVARAGARLVRTGAGDAEPADRHRSRARARRRFRAAPGRSLPSSALVLPIARAGLERPVRLPRRRARARGGRSTTTTAASSGSSPTRSRRRSATPARTRKRRTRRGAGRDRPREDRVLQQRQPRVPHAAHADARPDRGWPARIPTQPLPPGAARTAGARAPQRAAPAEAGQHAARLRAHRGGRARAGLRRRPISPRSPSISRAASTPAMRSARAASCVRRLPARCPSAVHVDPAMWEKIVLNLLSNAFKFTFEGEIRVALRWRERSPSSPSRTPASASPSSELPRIFERFHRVEGARGRSHEGTGIGLALVQELVRLHGGDVEVHSALGQGTTFTCACRPGPPHAVAQRLAHGAQLAPTGIGPGPFLAEAAPVERRATAPRRPRSHPSRSGRPHPGRRRQRRHARLPVAAAVARAGRVEAVSDGAQALAAARAQPPDLILSDVMMPGLDGLGAGPGAARRRADADHPRDPALGARRRRGHRRGARRAARTTTWSSRSPRTSCWRASTRS